MSVVINLDGELDQWRSQVEADMSAGKLEDLDFSGNDAGMYIFTENVWWAGGSR